MLVLNVIPKANNNPTGDGFIGKSSGAVYLFGEKGVLGQEAKISIHSSGNIYDRGPYATVEGDRLIRIKSISLEVEEV